MMTTKRFVINQFHAQLFTSMLFLVFPIAVFADNKFQELQDRLKNLKGNETVEDVLKEYSGNEKSPSRSVISAQSVPATGDLSSCSYDPFKITFLCDPQWPAHEEEGIIIYTIAASPNASLSITKVSDKLKYLEQVNKADLELTDQYADGFVLQDTMLKDRKAKMVMGFSKADPEIRYLDYYLLNNGALYSVLFAVGPKEEWDKYKFLIKTIAESIDFK